MTIRNAASNMTAAVLQMAGIRRPSSQQNVLVKHSRSCLKLLVLALAVSFYACGGASDPLKDTAASRPAGSSSSPKASSPWGSFKVGSFVKAKTTVSTQMMGRTTDTSTETTTTLAELTSDKAVVDIEATVMGHTTKTRSEIPLNGPVQSGPTASPSPGQNATTGTDTVVVAGKSLDCKTFEAETETGGNKVKTKTWTSDQVPGSLVKSVSISSGSLTSTTTMEVVDFKAN